MKSWEAKRFTKRKCLESQVSLLLEPGSLGRIFKEMCCQSGWRSSIVAREAEKVNGWDLGKLAVTGDSRSVYNLFESHRTFQVFIFLTIVLHCWSVWLFDYDIFLVSHGFIPWIKPFFKQVRHCQKGGISKEVGVVFHLWRSHEQLASSTSLKESQGMLRWNQRIRLSMDEECGATDIGNDPLEDRIEKVWVHQMVSLFHLEILGGQT